MKWCAMRTILNVRIDVHFDADQEKNAVHVVIGYGHVQVVTALVVELKDL